ncbi:hypothetical protein HYX08_07045 [Candidatus Woesearchaeota archaeon]|nr:hypothetical protein [Candidatus Woesearchaeota archaeon]
MSKSEIKKLLDEDASLKDGCNLCNESKFTSGYDTGYGIIVYKNGTLKNGWFATLSPKTGGDPEHDFTVQLMPCLHLTHFSQIAPHKGMMENYGVAFSRICMAISAVLMQEEGLKAGTEEKKLSMPLATYGKSTTWKKKKEHLHLKIFPFRGNIGQPYTVDSSFGKKEIFMDSKKTEFVKMAPVKKKKLSRARLGYLAKRLISLLER